MNSVGPKSSGSSSPTLFSVSQFAPPSCTTQPTSSVSENYLHTQYVYTPWQGGAASSVSWKAFPGHFPSGASSATPIPPLPLLTNPSTMAFLAAPPSPTSPLSLRASKTIQKYLEVFMLPDLHRFLCSTSRSSATIPTLVSMYGVPVSTTLTYSAMVKASPWRRRFEICSGSALVDMALPVSNGTRFLRHLLKPFFTHLIAASPLSRCSCDFVLCCMIT